MFANKIKYQRAIAECGKDATPEQVKEKYVAIGGLFIEEEISPEKETIVEKVVKKVTKKK